MKIILKGQVKEIAALVVELQGQAIPADAVAAKLAERLNEAASYARIP